MAGTRGLGRWIALVWLAGALLAALTVPSIALAVPTAPGVKDATVYQGGVGVTVWWTASTDVNPGPIQYTVYRDDVPMSLTTYLANGELVTTTADTTVTVTPKADEIARKFTYYYLVVATNTSTGLKAVSTNVTPNVHGGLRSGYSTLNCQLCHDVHGVGDENYLGAATRYKCYRCHGNTDAATNYGDKAIRNVQRDFYDYTSGQTIPPTVSRHYNATMQAAETECTSCHTPHKSPYYVNPLTALKDDAISYTQLLRVERNDATYFYSKDNAIAGNAFCFECHGSNTATLDFNAGAGAYDSTAGDHNSANYATTAAHGDTQVYPNADGHRTNPAIQCEACHNKHASPADKLIAYRNDDYVGATTTTYAQAELCYACHSAAGYAAEIAAGTATGNTNFAWNGRDVKAQFGKASKHPTVARLGGPVAQPYDWTQTTQADFAGDSLANAVAKSTGSVELAPIYANGTAFSDDFSAGWGAWTTNGGRWTVASGYANWQKTAGTTRETGYIERAYDMSALQSGSTPTLTFSIGTNALDFGADYYQVQYSINGGAFTDLVAQSATARTWPTTLGPYSLTGAAGSNNVVLRFYASTSDTTEWVRYDDVVITGMVTSGTYEISGSVIAGPITPTGSLVSWGTLDFTETQPGGTNLTVDVLDAADDSVLLANAADGASLSALSASSLKLRANLTGAAPTPRTTTDNFNDNTFDTAKWADVQLNSTDPDAATTSPWSDTTTFASTWNGWTPTGSYWTIAGGYAEWAPDLVAQQVGYFERTFDLTTVASPQLAFDLGTNSMDLTEDYYRVQYSVNGGAWQTLVERTDGTDSVWPTAMGPYALTGAAGSNNVAIRFTAALTDDSFTPEYVRYDNIVVSGTQSVPATNLWPSETGGALTLRAEGSGFGRNSAGTAITDEGEFTYIKPAAADWVDTQDFDMVVRVPSYNNLAGNGWMKAGLMVRTGTTEANAYATNAAMVGLYVSDTNGVVFQSRTTAGGAASANTAGTGDAPVYLKLTRRGNVITGYQSTDGTSWTQVGSQTVTMSAYVLPGVSLTPTSAVNNSYSEATFDDFSITEAGITATATPALLDWTVSYTAYPPVTTGSLTCANCHNVHSVQKGTVGTAWQVIRASLPSNTKTNYAGTPTQFCLECHDGTAPTTTANSATVLVPYTVEFTDKSAYPFFPGWNKTVAGADWSASAHNSTTITLIAGNIGCQTCHDPHASDNARLTAYTYQEDSASNGQHTGTVVRNNTSAYAEQELCYACHDAQSGAGCGCHGANYANLNAEAAFTGTNTYRHPVETSGRHSDLETGAQLGQANRHAECADCHDPHAAKAGIHTAGSSLSASVLRGATGVNPNYPAHTATSANWTTIPASSYTTERLDGGTGDYEALLCFKCHSAYSGQPFSVTTSSGTYTSTDVAMEFNPSNFSEHNVLGQTLGLEQAFTVSGQSITWTKPATDGNWLTAAWAGRGGPNAMMTCTDCHSNTATTAARGPHGSSQEWLIDPSYPTSWNYWGGTESTTPQLSGSSPTGMSLSKNGAAAAGIICEKCHGVANLDTVNNVHSNHNDRGSEGAYCRHCHIGVPHGWKRPRMIAYTTDPAPYAAKAGGLDAIRMLDSAGTPISRTATNWNKDNDCDDSCGKHTFASGGTAWP